ncbi:hypothetical protein C5167_045266 [Papaver somniferum]|uniref:Cation/H+ exchanger domain-containing protein n=1 Tax=Papaver somniferum TaxID=3469 RepID=A0A4Y7LCW6_PAPSO|nr:hypothetical protein C5167_045266 [Papaver somniferum]
MSALQAMLSKGGLPPGGLTQGLPPGMTLFNVTIDNAIVLNIPINGRTFLCFDSSKAGSKGLWSGDNPLFYIVDNFLMQFSIGALMIRFLMFIMQPLHQTSFVPQVLAGLLIGPSGISRDESFKQHVFTLKSVYPTETLGVFGCMLYLFVIGLKMDVGIIKRCGKRAWFIGLAIFILPLLLTIPLAYILAVSFKLEHSLESSLLFVAILESSNSFHVICCLLADPNLLNSELGYLATSASMISGLLSMTMLNIGFTVKQTMGSGAEAWVLTIVSSLTLIFVIVLVLRPIVLWMIRESPEGKPVKEWYLTFIMAMMMLSAFLSELFGQHLFFGPTIFGLAIPDGPPIGSALTDELEWFTTELFLPLFYMILGGKMDFISGNCFTVMTVSSMLLTAVISPVLRYLYNPSKRYISYKKRTIQHNKRNTELRVAVCVYDQENVPTMINLLQASNPTPYSPIAVFVLHLVELVGRTAPMFITHQSLNKLPARSELIINTFRIYEEQNKEFITLRSYTSVAPLNTIHDDVCTLGLNRRTSLIIVPFHVQWNVDGTIQSTHHRSVNINILNNAPCSIAVLIDRGNLSGSVLATYRAFSRVCMIFLGGPDDREALAYATRMCDQSSLHLTLFRVTEAQCDIQPSNHHAVEQRKDDEMVNEFKENHADCERITYREEAVNNGVGTVRAIRMVEENFELILVGRRHEADSPLLMGLTEWSEYPELGLVGDMLASPDLVQQICSTEYEKTFATSAMKFVLEPMGVTSFVAQMIGGLLIGPSFLGKTELFAKKLFANASLYISETVQYFGSMFFLFLIGVKTDISMVRKSGKMALLVGFLSFCLPSVLATLVAYILVKDNIHWVPREILESLPYIAGLTSLSSPHVINSFLADLNLLNSELGRIAMSASMISGGCSLISVFLVLTFKQSELSKTPENIMWTLCSCLTIIIIIIYVIQPIMLWVHKRHDDAAVKEEYVFFIFLTVLVSSLAGEIVGEHYLVGPLLLGLVVPPGPPLGAAIDDKLDCFGTGILVPVLVIARACPFMLSEIRSSTFVVVQLLAFFSFVGKFFGTIITAIYSEMPIQDALTLGLVMNVQGVLDIQIWVRAMGLKLIDREIYGSLVLTMLIMTGSISVIVKFLYDPSKKYVENVPSIVNLLEASNATTYSPICVYTLHLIQLQGRPTPLLITHKTNPTDPSEMNPTTRIIKSFTLYAHHNKGIVSVSFFTAISPYNTMHDDICSLGLDKRTSLIIIPFHHQPAILTQPKSTTGIRRVNINVLKKAPCSVAVIFLGGPDDREALAYGARIGDDINVKLTVIRFMHSGERNNQQKSKEKRKDQDTVNGFRLQTAGSKNVEYIEEMVKDGVELISSIKRIENSFELLIVGREHGKVSSKLLEAFNEWNEFPELGVIGDMLVSSDSKTSGSILVMQQRP